MNDKGNIVYEEVKEVVEAKKELNCSSVVS